MLKKILSQSSAYILGEFLSKSIIFLMLPYLTRKLGVAGYGELSYYLSVLSLIALFIAFNQGSAVTRYYYFYGKHALNSLIQVAYTGSFLVFIAFFALFFVFKSTILMIIAVTAYFQAVLDIQFVLRQCQKKAFQYLIIQVVYSVILVASTIAFLEWIDYSKVSLRILSILFSSAVTVLLLMLFSTEFSPFKKIHYKRAKLLFIYSVTFCFPIVLHSLASLMKTYFDKVVIFEFFSAGELGIYSAGMQVALVFNVFLMAVNKAVLPYYYEHLRNGKFTLQHVKKYALLSLIFVPIPALISLVLPEQFYTLLLGNSFGQSKYYTSLFLIGFSFMVPYLILVNFIFYHGKNFIAATTSIASTAVYMVCVLITSRISVEAIPVSLIISNAFTVLVLYLVLRKFNRLAG